MRPTEVVASAIDWWGCLSLSANMQPVFYFLHPLTVLEKEMGCREEDAVERSRMLTLGALKSGQSRKVGIIWQEHQVS